MSNASFYIKKWVMEDDPTGDSKVAISARIPHSLNAKLEQLASEFGINKTEALIAAIDVGVDEVLTEWQNSQLPKEPKPPMTMAEFALRNPSKHGQDLEMTYDAYLEHAQEEYELKLSAYEAMKENQ